jgi:hypothetical protein
MEAARDRKALEKAYSFLKAELLPPVRPPDASTKNTP